jgi:hypothetical protein
MCKDCIHEKVCLHKENVQNDTYAYMGVHYNTKKCEFFKNNADFVEAVRCKDCVYWDARITTGRCEGVRNGLIYDYTDGSDFCSYGERKENG